MIQGYKKKSKQIHFLPRRGDKLSCWFYCERKLFDCLRSFYSTVHFTADTLGLNNKTHTVSQKRRLSFKDQRIEAPDLQYDHIHPPLLCKRQTAACCFPANSPPGVVYFNVPTVSFRLMVLGLYANKILPFSFSLFGQLRLLLSKK